MRKPKLKKKNSFVPINCSRWLCVVAIAVLLASCGGGSDGGGPTGVPGGGGTIIGTGVLEGTASSRTLVASKGIEIKSITGEKSMAPIGNDGRFALDADSLNGTTGPFLLRASTAIGEYLYTIGYPQKDETLTQNIHSYTDAAARNWFASNGLDIDSAFAGDGPIAQLPPQATLRAISRSLQSIVGGALEEYDSPETDLDTVIFAADNTGVDLFLDNNPVIINNGTINIFILDDETQVLTPSSTNVSLATDLVTEDLTPPTTPESVRALASMPDEIVVVWNAATDNIGVTTYEVFRDGELVETTPFPVYTDTGLLANTQYSYTVVAIDSSGLKSAGSVAAMSATQGTLDTTAPPAPLLVMLEPGVGSIGVSWSQTEINDVKAFNVYRTGTEDVDFSVTSDFINDVNVLGGSEYCYEIAAEDASGNESARTAVQCETTLGTPPTAAPVVTAPNPVVTTPGVLSAPTLDVTGLACTQELPNDGTFNTDDVLPALLNDCYSAPQGLTINEPANLTVEPGVVVKFASSTQLLVDDGASLTAVGSAAAPIVFSAIDPTPGFWDGVEFYYSNSSRNQLDFVQIEYAGGSVTGENLNLLSRSSGPSRVSIKNSTFRNGLGYGIKIPADSIVGAFEGNLIVGNNTPLLISADAANVLGADSRFSGNAMDRVRLSGASISTATSLAKLDVPYITEGFDIDNSLTVAPGVEIFFESGGELSVNSDGSLKAVGTVAEPILFTATDPTPGFWNGIEIFYSSGDNRLAYVTVEYGGAGSNGANLDVISLTSTNSRLTANNVTLRHALNDGFAISAGSALTKFEQITSTQNGRTGRVALDVVGQIGSGASFIGNDVDLISVGSGTIQEDASWLTHDVPYALDDLTITAGLTLTEGATFVMDAGGKITVRDDGYLSAVGSALNNIVFTGNESVPGYWEGIEFYYAASTSNRLSHAVVEYAGAGVADATTTGNISMKCIASLPARLIIDNTMLNFGLGWGMYAEPEGCEVTLGVNVTYTSNAAGGFNLMP